MANRSSARLQACLVALAALAIAPSPHAQQQQPIFRSGTAVVEVTVNVRDRDGLFVPGLTAGDFEILEDGQTRRIESMYVVRGPDARANAAADTRPELTGAARSAPRTFVFAFDVEQMSPRSFTRARDAAVAFAKQRLVPDDLSALVVLGASSGGRVSREHEALINGLRQVKPSGGQVSRDRPLREWPRVLSFQEAAEIARGNQKVLEEARDRACRERNMTGSFPCVDPGMLPGGGSAPAGKSPGTFNAEANREWVEQQLREKSASYIAETRVVALRSIAALESLSQALEAIRGRKTIVWFTEGSPILEAANQAREAAVRAAQSGVAIYTIDPRGLQTGAAGVEDVDAQELGHELFRDTGDLPAMMASTTGGLYIRNENRLERALARVEDDTSSYYVIGYAAGDAAARPERQLTVHVKREGLEARVRHGFMAPQHTVALPGAMVASNMVTAPGTRWELAAPTTAPARSTPSTPPPSTLNTPNPRPHAPTTEKVLRLRNTSGVSTSGAAARAWAAYERGDLETALPLFEEAARREDVRPWALYALGFTYVGMNRPKDAIAAWERVRAAAPDFMQVYLDLAAHYAQQSEGSDALDVLRDAARRWPAEPEPQNGIGVLMVRRNALDEAIDAFTKATELAAADPLGWLNLGRAYELRYDRGRRYDEILLKWVGPQGDRMKALASYERCVKLGGPYAEQAAEAIARMNWSQ